MIVCLSEYGVNKKVVNTLMSLYIVSQLSIVNNFLYVFQYFFLRMFIL